MCPRWGWVVFLILAAPSINYLTLRREDGISSSKGWLNHHHV